MARRAESLNVRMMRKGVFHDKEQVPPLQSGVQATCFEMCQLLEVSRSGYYAWQSRPESQRAQDDRALREAIKRIHVASGGVYGAPKIHAELREQRYQCGRHRVARLMRQAGLCGCTKRRFKVTTQRDPSHAVADNLLQQDFSASRPNERDARLLLLSRQIPFQQSQSL